MAICLVTGGAGFIGSHLTGYLLRQGHTVRVLDNFATGKQENLNEVMSQIELIEGDIRDLGLVRRAVAGVEYVFHQAALPSVPRSIADPLAANAVNVDGTLNVLVAARDAQVRRVVFASSSSVYGDNPTLPKREDLPPQPLSPYAATKLMGEHYCRLFYQLYGLETVVLRYFNVFGPRQDPASQYAAVIPKFITKMMDRQPLTIYGDGEQSRDFTFVENVVRANALAMDAPDAAGQVFNVGCGARYTLNYMVASLQQLMNRSAQVIYMPPKPGDVKHSLASIERAGQYLGYAPQVAFEEGLRRTFAYQEW
ncbi:MAG: SDR family oxidoreductase [Abditibacteriales bacterium]|nr:SDR family oxidoreductase [Abditibacteriales bacterium]